MCAAEAKPAYGGIKPWQPMRGPRMNLSRQCIKHGIDYIYHASFTDEETLDLLEAVTRKSTIVAPGLRLADQYRAQCRRIWHQDRALRLRIAYERELDDGG